MKTGAPSEREKVLAEALADGGASEEPLLLSINAIPRRQFSGAARRLRGVGRGNASVVWMRRREGGCNGVRVHVVWRVGYCY